MYLIEAGIELNLLGIIGLIVLGLVLGLVATIGGIGGGPLIMPIFLLIFMYENNLAKGTSILLVFLGSGIATYQHVKNKRVHLLSMFLLSLVASLGSISIFLLESVMNIDARLFSIIFGAFEFFIALRMLFNGFKAFQADNVDKNLDNQPINGEKPVEPVKPNQKKVCLNIIKNPKKMWSALPLFYLAGVLAAFLGIGGGPVNTPVLYEIIGLPIYNATAGSSTIIFFNSIVNLIMYGLRGEIDWIVGAIMGVGMMIGAFIGAKTASKVPRSATLGLLAVLLVIAGTKMIIG